MQIVIVISVVILTIIVVIFVLEAVSVVIADMFENALANATH